MDGPENLKDSSQGADSSGGNKGTSDTTFTSEQMAASSKKAAEDALSAAGRTAKAFEQREAAVKASEERGAAEVLARREAELKAIPTDDAQSQTDTRARHRAEDANVRLAKVEAELEAEKVKGTQRDSDAARTTQEIRTREIAARLKVDPVLLRKLVSTTDGSIEAIEAEANILPKVEIKPPILSDSGKTAGGDQQPESSGGKMRAGFDAKYPPK